MGAVYEVNNADINMFIIKKTYENKEYLLCGVQAWNVISEYFSVDKNWTKSSTTFFLINVRFLQLFNIYIKFKKVLI